jgi:hypothetical protein
VEGENFALARTLGSLQFQSKNPFFSYLKSFLKGEKHSCIDFYFLITAQGEIPCMLIFLVNVKVSLLGHKMNYIPHFLENTFIARFNCKGLPQKTAKELSFLALTVSLPELSIIFHYSYLGGWDMEAHYSRPEPSQIVPKTPSQK